MGSPSAILTLGLGPLGAGGGSCPVPPVGVTLSIVDQADGTGATATIAGAAGYTNDVYVYSFGADGTLTDEGTFTRSGNGTVDLVLATGMYFAVLANDDFFASTPAFFAVTGSAQSLYGDLLAAVQTTLISLGLSGIASNVLLKKFVWLRDGTTYPAAFVCPYNEQWPNQGTNASDDTGYGISIALVRATNRDNTLAQDDLLLDWRETVRKAFRSQRIAGVSSAHYTTLVEPGPVFDPAIFGNQYDATFLTLRAWARESRGS
jgi:hypothetical protein